MLRVTPIYGSRFEKEGTAEAPSCTLVEYGNVRVLWNVGWWAAAEKETEEQQQQQQQQLEKEEDDNSHTRKAAASFPKLPEHDVLIVSDSTLNALGGLPLYYEQYTKKQRRGDKEEDEEQDATTSSSFVPPMYATFPTVKMGQMTLYDHHAALSLDGGRPPYSLEQMDDAFANLKTIKYSQSIPVFARNSYSSKDKQDNKKNKGSNQKKPALSITAFRAGHVVGGAFFVLKRMQDETIVVLTPPTYNIAKELHLDSSTLLKYGATPDVLVTYPGGPAMKYISKLYHDNKERKGGNSIMKPYATRGSVTRQLVETILSVLRRDGHVLLPVDASGRVLELVLLLSQHWDRHRLGGAYNLVWLGPMVKNTLDFCRSQLEWMASQLGTQFDDSNTSNRNNHHTTSHPFSLRNVHLCSSIQELDAVIRQNNNNPTCVLASGLTLDHGPARDLFLRWADNADHAIVFTDSSRCFLRRYKHRAATAATTTTTTEDRMDISEGDEQAASSQQKQDDLPTTQMQRQSSLSAMAAGGEYGASTDATAATDQQDDDDNENTMVVGTALGPEEKPSPFCAAAQLLQQWCLAKWEGREMDDSIFVDVQVPHRAPLVGQELNAFLAEEEAKRQYQKQQEEQQAMLREVEIAKGQLRLGEDEGTTGVDTAGTSGGTSGTGGDAAKATGAGGKTSSSTVVKGRPKKKSRFDSSLFLKFSKPLHCM